MRSGFTMIELIFIIVIIGILGSIAVPKLAATRDDAKRAGLISNTKICVGDLISAYKGQGVKVDMDTNRACVSAKKQGANITYSGDFIHVEDTDPSIDGDYIFKGVRISI